MPTETEHDRLETLVGEYLRAFNERDEEGLSELLAEDVVHHGIREDRHGHEEVREVLGAHFETFPDYTGETELVVAGEDAVAVRYTASGTHSGEYRGVEPTGHTAEWSGIAIYRVDDGEIAEIWIEEDRLGLYEELEMADPPAHLRL